MFKTNYHHKNHQPSDLMRRVSGELFISDDAVSG